MDIFVLALSLVMLATAIGVVAFRNPLHSALCLIANFIGVAIVFATLGANFLAAAQVIIYAGAIMVLVVFVVMLLNVKRELVKGSERWLIGLAALFGFGFCALTLPLLARQFSGLNDVPHGPLSGSVTEFGVSLFNHYALQIQLAGILLVLAMLGSQLLGRRSKASHEER